MNHLQNKYLPTLNLSPPLIQVSGEKDKTANVLDGSVLCDTMVREKRERGREEE